jgi:hypothetical protein
MSDYLFQEDLHPSKRGRFKPRNRKHRVPRSQLTENQMLKEHLAYHRSAGQRETRQMIAEELYPTQK